MKKVVLQLGLHDEKCSKKAMKKVSRLSGLVSIDMDVNNKKLTLTGNIDPVEAVNKLKKICCTEIVTVGPAKEPPKPPPPPKPEPPKPPPPQCCPCFEHKVCHCYPYPTPAYYVVEADPCRSSCVIC